VTPIDTAPLVAALNRARDAEARVRAYHCLGVLLAVGLATIVGLVEALRATAAH
jgi:uncharacterized membrane protein